jgi:hypothetical protein
LQKQHLQNLTIPNLFQIQHLPLRNLKQYIEVAPVMVQEEMAQIHTTASKTRELPEAKATREPLMAIQTLTAIKAMDPAATVVLE